MKKLFLLFIISFSFTGILSAQDQWNAFSLAGNLSYGTKAESLGVGLRAQYGFTANMRASAEYKYYIERHGLSAWGLSADLHYVANVSKTFALYPLAGVSFSRWTYDIARLEINGIEQPKHSDSRLGLNLGFGGQIATSNNTFIQIEAKEALIKDYTQFVVSVGFMYQF